jgi:predicted ATPase/class 3 adenylate cyclase
VNPETDRPRLLSALAALEAQRAVLGDEVTALAQAPLRQLLAALDEPAAPQLRRAQVTVLFADIADSTALAARLDAEDVLQIFGRLLERAAEAVRARGGRVLRYTGDGLKAGFGTQGTREDDAAQAVLAGLDILAAAREHAAWVAREFGIGDFAVRVGAHTGEVALGAGFEADNTLTGDTVNLAARMEQTAPRGGLRISAETWAHVRGDFVLEAQPPLPVKGVSAPLPTWLVLGARPRQARASARGIEGLATRMVGRQAELAALQAACAQLPQQRGLRVCTVLAEAGLGKSRLLAEFEAWCRDRPERTLQLRARATPHTGTQAFGLLRDLLATRLQIDDADSPARARARLEQAIVPLFEPDDGTEAAQAHAHLMGHLVGIDIGDSPHLRGILHDPRQLRQRALHATTQWLRRLARHEGQPLMLLLEDLHWADDESLDVLPPMLAALDDWPVLLLGLARPALLERRPGWPGAAWPEGERHPRLELAPLDSTAALALAHELLQRLPSVPEALTSLLTRHAEGNPYYLEELVKVLIDRGAIRTDGPQWRVDTERLVLSKLPTTLTGVLQARLDALPAAEKRALQQASVVGTVFWEPALAAVDATAPGQLPALQQRRLARAAHATADEPAGEGPREYAFHHQLLQQVTYGTVLKQDRRDGHARVARWLAGLSGLRATDVPGLAAEHFELAGDTDTAAEYHARAAEQAWQRLAHERVHAHVARALALLDGHPAAGRPAQAPLRWRLLATREQSLGLQARRDEQGADLDTLEQLAHQLADDRRLAQVEQSRCVRGLRVADWAAAERGARAFLAAATRAGEPAPRLEAQRLLATVMDKLGHTAAGRELALQTLAEARQRRLHAIEAGLLNTLALMAEAQGDPIAALELEQPALAIHQALGDRVREASMRSNIGLRWLKLGHLARARQELEASLQRLRANGDLTFEGAASAFLSLVVLWQGDAGAARALAQRALDIALAAQARDNALIAWMHLGEAQLALGALDDAQQAFDHAWAEAQALRPRWQWDAGAGRARVALARGDAAKALQALQPLLDDPSDARLFGGAGDPRLVMLGCHQALSRAGDLRAPAWLERAHRSLTDLAAGIADPALRAGFLQQIPHHRAIVAAWAARAERP